VPANSPAGKETERSGVMDDDLYPEWRWTLFCQLWDQLGTEDILAAHVPLHKRWQLDRLVEHMRLLDEFFEEQAVEELLRLAEME
jgi:hypothetical protein